MSISKIIEPDSVRAPMAAKAELAVKGPSRAAVTITLGLLLVGLNVGVLLYTAKNASELRVRQAEIAALQRSLETMRLQIKRQTAMIEKAGSAETIEKLVKMAEQLGTTVSSVENRMNRGLFSFGGSVVLSAPDKYAAQQLKKPFDQQAAEMNLPTVSADYESDGQPIADLPQYERTVSPEGRLILRKVR